MATNRITESDIKALAKRINVAAGMPLEPYSDGRPQAGCYHISYAYGGVCMQRMSLKDGCSGVTTPLGGGHVTKRELYKEMSAFLAGLETKIGE